MALSKIKVNNSDVIGVDQEPISKSDNLVYSKGISNKINEVIYGYKVENKKTDYGCETIGTYSDESIENINYFGVYDPCEFDSVLETVTGYFSRSGTVKIYVCYGNENNPSDFYFGKSFTRTVSAGWNTFDVSNLNVEIQKGGTLITEIGNGYVSLGWGVNGSVRPVACHIQDNLFYPRNDGVFCTLIWTCNSTNDVEYETKTYGQLINNTDGVSYSGNVEWVTSDSICQADGIIQSIIADFGSSGTMTFGCAFADQNNVAIFRQVYNVSVPNSGRNNIDVSSLNIKINKGDFLMVKVQTKGVAGPQPNYKVEMTEDSAYPWGYGVFDEGSQLKIGRYQYICVSLSYTVKTVFANVQKQIDDLNVRVSILEEKSTNLYVNDSVTGVKYKIVSNNGVLGLEEVYYGYHKVLVLGNSITIHGYATYWPADNRGMAATKREYDICGILETQLNAPVTALNIADWERNFSTDLDVLIGSNLQSDTDLVVIRLGENVSDTSGFQQALVDLIAYIGQKSPSAKIMITGQFWANNTKENAIINASNACGIVYVKINQYDTSFYKEAVGHYTYNSDYTSISEITHGGVAEHPNNAGMCAIANAILSKLEYPLSQNTYSLKNVTVGGVSGLMYVLD